ncbi:MAG: hypothetical protein AAFP19_18815, partial [Bacteroidota bacterium]
VGQSNIERNDQDIYEWQSITKVDLTSETLLDKINLWLIMKGIEGIQLIESEKSKSLIYYDAVTIGGMMTPGDMSFLTRIDVKEGKFRLTCNQFVYTTSNPNSDIQGPMKLELPYIGKKGLINRTEKQLKSYIKGLVKFLEEGIDDDW